jgi:hypothetical protein
MIRVIFRNIGGWLGDLQAAAFGALEIFKNLPQAEHHFTDGETGMFSGTVAYAAAGHAVRSPYLSN